MPDLAYATKTNDGLTETVYRGDRCVLLAFDLPADRTADLAGFAVQVTPPDNGRPYWIKNRISFDSDLRPSDTAEDRTWTPTNKAPLQTFSWAHFPATPKEGIYTFDVTAMYFTGEDKVKDEPTVSVKSRVTAEDHPNFDLAFTRGYIQSQAYVDRFKDNLKFRPDDNSIDYNTAEFKTKYEWLGGGARELIFDFLDDCVADANCTLDVLAYDLDEPDILRRLATIGRQGRLRAFLDDAPLHTGGAREVQARALLNDASPGSIKVGHLGRFQHHKVLVKRKNGQAVKALAGSANFSVRGLYVQANNVLVYRDPDVAGRFGGVFEALFGAAKGRSKSAFLQSPLSRKWFPADGDGKPEGKVSFAPHADSKVSLKEVADAINGAGSSVLFAIMGLTGGGPVLDAVRGFASEDRIFTYGITQAAESGSIGLYKPGSMKGITVPFATLSRFVPAPFRKEFDGGKGQTIHHKFVVVDFNGDKPVVFCGSSNLAAGGEEANGDNLFAITDPRVVGTYAVEAIRLVDHYHFRASVRESGHNGSRARRGLHLQHRTEGDRRWWQRFYDEEDIRMRQRQLFARPEEG